MSHDDKNGEQFLRVNEPRECPACWGNGYTAGDSETDKVPCGICAETGKVLPYSQVSATDAPDTERLNWLERMHVEVRVPAVWGSRSLFHASPTDTDGDEEPSDIRAQIDYQRNGGTKPVRRSDGESHK